MEKLPKICGGGGGGWEYFGQYPKERGLVGSKLVAKVSSEHSTIFMFKKQNCQTKTNKQTCSRVTTNVEGCDLAIQFGIKFTETSPGEPFSFFLDKIFLNNA